MYIYMCIQLITSVCMCLESSGVSGGSVDEVLVGEARHPEFDVTIPYPPGEKKSKFGAARFSS